MNNYAHNMTDFWLFMTRIYSDRWTTREGEKDDGTWRTQLSKLSPRLIQNGLSKLKSRYPSWPPNVFEFENLCELQPIDLGLPPIDKAYEAAAHSNWFHPFIFHVAQKVGVYEIKNNPKRYVMRAFERAYDEGFKELLAGKQLATPAAKEFQLEYTKNEVTPEHIQAHIAEMRGTISNAKTKGVKTHD